MESFNQYMCMPKLNEIKRTHDDEYKKLIKKMVEKNKKKKQVKP